MKSLKLATSSPMSTQIARDDLKKPPAFKMAAIDILGQGVGNGGSHYAAIMIWGENTEEANARRDAIIKAVNSHRDLVFALKYAIGEIERLRGLYLPHYQGKLGEPDEETVRTGNAALKLAESEGAEDYRTTRGQVERGHKDVGCPVHFCDTCAESRRKEGA